MQRTCGTACLEPRQTSPSWRQKLAPRQRFVESPTLTGGPSRNPFLHAQRGVARPRLTFPNFNQAQSAPYESGGASKPFGLLLDEPFEIKRPREAHRRGPAKTHRRQDEHKRHRREKKEPADFTRQANELLKCHPVRIGGQNLAIGAIKSIGKLMNEFHLPMRRLHDHAADLGVISMPARPKQESKTGKNDDQIEPCVFIAPTRHGGAEGRRHHLPPTGLGRLRHLGGRLLL